MAIIPGASGSPASFPDGFLVSDGTVSAPTFRFSDTQTGFYRPSVNEWALSSNGVQTWLVSATGAHTIGSSSSDAIVHKSNGSLSIGTNIPSFSSTTTRYVGNKFGSVSFRIDSNTASGGSNLWGNGYNDGTNNRRSVANAPVALFSVRNTGGVADVAFRFIVDPSISHAADSVASLADIGSATIAGAWTLGPTSTADLTHVFAGSAGARRPVQWNGNNTSSSAGTVGTLTQLGDRLITYSNATALEAKYVTGDFTNVAAHSFFCGGSSVTATDKVFGVYGIAGGTGYVNVGQATVAGAWTLGPAVSLNYNGQVHKINGGLQVNQPSSNTTDSAYSFDFTANCLANGTHSRTSTTLGGVRVTINPRTSDSASCFSIATTPAGSSLITGNTQIASATQAGAWTFGSTTSGTVTHLMRSGTGAILYLNSGLTTSGSGARIEIKDGATATAQIGHLNTTTVLQVQTGETGGVQLNNGATAWSAMSDLALKNRLSGMTYGLKEVLLLKPQFFNYKNDSEDAARRLGFVAQEVQPIFPELVETVKYMTGEGFLSLDTQSLIPVLVNSIKELNAKVELLEAQLNA